MSLRIQLLSKSPKPKHQSLDAESLSWIASNKPTNLLKNYKINREVISIIEKNNPWNWCNANWFSSRFVKNGIHGFRHACRVAIYAASLAIRFSKKNINNEIDASIFLGLLHDCRRENDNADYQHGMRTANWIKKNSKILPKNLRSLLPAICFSISMHNDPYENIFKKKEYKKFKFFTDILKTADALDRYRFPRSDWWPSLDFIILHPNVEDLSFAFDFTLKSEMFFLKSKNNHQALFKAWQQLKKNKPFKVQNLS